MEESSSDQDSPINSSAAIFGSDCNGYQTDINNIFDNSTGCYLDLKFLKIQETPTHYYNSSDERNFPSISKNVYKSTSDIVAALD